MTKPRFTVDPPPIGASVEEELDWSKRQYDRIHDKLTGSGAIAPMSEFSALLD